jgi:glutathione-regulated potassium-efflux system protein KefB
MSTDGTASELTHVVTLLGAAVVVVPLFRRLGLGSVLGYLVAGLAIGPFGFGFFSEPQAILHVAELGVVLFLFVVGLEMQPSHLWGLRRQIFGLGALQVIACVLALGALGLALGFQPTVAFVAAAGFVLTSTAIVMQLLSERGDIALPRGQRMVSILLFEDLLIVPLLAIVALLAPEGPEQSSSGLMTLGIAAGSLLGLVAAGVYLLNPLFRLLAQAHAREVMTAAALLVVLGAALVMQLGGLSMAMGAFIAGALLSESTFRHQIEADVEPFRGILLGLFFLAVGMSLDLSVVAAQWQLIVLCVPAMMTLKALCIYAVARALRASHADALDRAVLMAQGGEFAFVLFGAAEANKVLTAELNDALTAIVVLSMALTPLAVLVTRRYFTREVAPNLEGVEVANGQTSSVLIIGFGRFGQVTSQLLLARGIDVTIIDTDIEMIQSAEKFGFKIYYGDGTRLDVLQASGAASARAIAICTDNRKVTDRIVALCKHEFKQAKILARSFDREHALELVNARVDFQIRETFESALSFGEAALREIGVSEQDAREVAFEIRRRDSERFELEVATQDAQAGVPLLFGNARPHVPTPTPFTTPVRQSQLLHSEPTPEKALGG